MSMNLRGRLLAAVFWAGAGAAPASAETLADAIALAYESNPTLQAQRATQRALDENYVLARTGYRPTLSASATASYTERRVPRSATLVDLNGDGIRETSLGGFGISDSNAGSAGFTFTQPLWTGGRVAATVSAAQAEVLQGRENLRRVEAQVLAAVIQAYVDVRRDQEGLRIRQENVKVLTRQLEESQARFDVGEITRTDVAQSQARLAQSQAQLQSAQAQLAISRAAYAAVVGKNPEDLAPEPSLDHLLPGDPDAAFDVAETHNPQLRAQEYAEQASRARVAGAKAERMPSLSMRTQLTHGGAPVDPFERELFSREMTASATVTVPLFAGGGINSRIRQNVERNNADKITVETVRRGVLQNVTQLWSQLIASRANIASSEEQVRAARIAAEGTRQEQQVGLRTTIDVLNAEQELRGAELSQVSARRDEYVAAANILGVMGRLEARNLIPAVPRYDPKTNFKKLRVTWGWAPWEEPLSIIDHYLSIAPAPTPEERPGEPDVAAPAQPAPAN
jgi:outer membrane protein